MSEFYKCVTPSKFKLNRVYRLEHNYWGNTIGPEDNNSFIVIKAFTEKKLLLVKANGSEFKLKKGLVPYLAIPASTRRISWCIYEVTDKVHCCFTDQNIKVFKPFPGFIPIRSLIKNKAYSCMQFNKNTSKFERSSIIKLTDSAIRGVPPYYHFNNFDLEVLEGQLDLRTFPHSTYGLFYGFRYLINN